MAGEMVDRPVGRPTIMTPEVVNKLEAAFLLGCSDLEACFAADISKQTLYNYQDANPEFIDRKESLKANPIYVARSTVVREIAEKGELALKYLERKKKDEFSPSIDQNIGNKDGEAFKTSHTPTAEQMESLKQYLLMKGVPDDNDPAV